MSKSDAIIKDNILEFLVNDPYHAFTVENLWENLGQPCKSLLHFKILTDEMQNNGNQYFLIIENPPFISFAKNDFTQDFLDDGGFTAIQAKHASNEQILLKARNSEAIDRQNQFVINNWKAKMAPWQYYTFWPLLIIATLSTGFSIYKAFNTDDQKIIELRLEMDNIKETLQDQSKNISNFNKTVDLLIQNDSI